MPAMGQGVAPQPGLEEELAIVSPAVRNGKTRTLQVVAIALGVASALACAPAPTPVAKSRPEPSSTTGPKREDSPSGSGEVPAPRADAGTPSSRDAPVREPPEDASATPASRGDPPPIAGVEGLFERCHGDPGDVQARAKLFQESCGQHSSLSARAIISCTERACNETCFVQRTSSRVAKLQDTIAEHDLTKHVAEVLTADPTLQWRHPLQELAAEISGKDE